MVTKKFKKAAPKASTATISTIGEDQWWRHCHFDHAIHAALLLFNGAVGMSCLCCNLVGINNKQQYSPISYIQSHREKCKYHGIMCDWLSEHPDLHSMIPWTANLEGKLVRASPPTTAPIVDAFSLSTLTELQVELSTRCLLLFLLFKFPRGRRTIKLSAKAQAAADEQK